MDATERQHILDEEHLRLLRIGYFVMGGMAAFAVLFGLLYVAVGLLFTSSFGSLSQNSRGVPPTFAGWIFVGVGAFIILAAGGYALLAFLCARALRRRQSFMLCEIGAAFSCLHIPVGTVLGVFTFIVLGRPSVRAMFDPSFPLPPPPTGGTTA